MARATKLEKESLEAHVDLCEQRYNNLELRLSKIETKVEHIHADITNNNKSMTKVLIGATGTIIAGLLSTIVVILININ
jgi:tetrahydromethanopterin S-methyltransferase subunit G|tara:strand:- start:45 stop:281 length:237 start_codon:yes stop_codon:yes gene_type:complete